jgi:quinol monooxygenase YgiN
MKYGTRVLLIIFSLLTTNHLMSQSNTGHYMRLARIVVDSAQLESYRAALKEGMSTAVKIEPGVISLSAVYEKDRPTHVTVFEIYADENAYKAHIQTAHFLKYKTAVHGMVKSLELVDVSPIAMETK